jgi:hypothetical protein
MFIAFHVRRLDRLIDIYMALLKECEKICQRGPINIKLLQECAQNVSEAP